MKKSKILTKVMLAMVIVMLIFALVACGGGDKKTDKKDKNDKNNAAAELADQVVQILEGVNPLLGILNNATATSTLGADVALSVDYTTTKNRSASHVLAVQANASATTPQASISYKNSENEKGETGEWLNISYLNDYLYIIQPVTPINTEGFFDNSGKAKFAVTDKTKSNVAALSPAVKDLMAVAMDKISGIGKMNDGKGLALPETLKDFIVDLLTEEGGMGEGFVDMLSIESTNGGNKIVLGTDVFNMVSGLLPLLLGNTLTDLVGADLKDTIINALQSFLAREGLELSVEVKQSNKTINGVVIGYKDNSGIKVTIDLKAVLQNSAISISAPGNCSETGVLNLGVGASLDKKGVSAAVNAYAYADLAEAKKNIAFATVDVLNNGSKGHSDGYFNGESVYFNTKALYTTGINGTGKNYKATMKEKDATDPTNVVALINKAAAKFKDEAINGTSKKPEENNEISKGITQWIYEKLGGKPETETKTKDGKTETVYKKISQTQMMTQLNSKIGKYVRFTIDTSSSDNYFKTIKNIINAFAAADEWIIGGDLVKVNAPLNSFGDLLQTEKWLNKKSDGKLIDCTGGIFNWHKDLYKGGVVLYKEGEKNDLLDAVNVFLKNDTKDVTVELVADFVNYYCAALCYYTDQIDDAAINASIKAELDKYDKIKKDAKKEKKSPTSDQKKAHKTELEKYYTNQWADIIVGQIIGVSEKGTRTSVLANIIYGGLYFNLGCGVNGAATGKGTGLGGFIAIKQTEESTDCYATVNIIIKIVEKTAVSMDAIVAAVPTTGDELYAPEEYTAGKALLEDLKAVAKDYLKLENK